jgi:hypothetical protein
MYYSGYNRLFWGMIFLLFHINIGYISIIPNFIGYLFIFSGLNILSSQHELFKKGKTVAILLALLSLKDVFYNADNNLLSGQFFSLSLLSLLLDTVINIFNIYVIYVILTGIYELCSERDLTGLTDNVINSFRFYFIASTIILFFIPLSINLSTDLKFLIIIPGFFKFVASLCIIGIFRRCRFALKE